MEKKAKRSLDESEIETSVMGRRSSIGIIGGVVSAAVLVGSAETVEAQGCSDSDPRDPAGRGSHCGSGCSDSDPNDPGGNGRHCGRSGCSDSDPNDPAGNGRHCGRRSCSDSDPNDPGGRGRHC